MRRRLAEDLLHVLGGARQVLEVVVREQRATERVQRAAQHAVEAATGVAAQLRRRTREACDDAGERGRHAANAGMGAEAKGQEDGAEGGRQRERVRKRRRERDILGFSEIPAGVLRRSRDAASSLAESILPPNVRASAVPATQIGRVFGFASMATRLAAGVATDSVSRFLGGRSDAAAGDAGMGAVGQVADGFSGAGAGVASGSRGPRDPLDSATAEVLADSLAKMRGAALKVAQMVSIQDENVVSPVLVQALERVRQGADIMPHAQLEEQLRTNLGEDWEKSFQEFNRQPMAAASIGQVHRATLLDGTNVAMKIQYPGVAQSIDSDLENLRRVLNMTNLIPPGLFVDHMLEVARDELRLECDYEHEAANQKRYLDLCMADPVLRDRVRVPQVVDALSTREILTAELVPGVAINKMVGQPQEVRNAICRTVLYLTLQELFGWRYMQTDPNFGNFLIDPATHRMSLVDFGSCRAYEPEFVDLYIELVWAAANNDKERLLEVSHDLKYLNGEESAQMVDAHIKSGMAVGEPFRTHDEPFDFHGSGITKRVSRHGETFATHRLAPPPEQAYTLHRKLAGSYLMCIKLNGIIPCRDMLEDAYERYWRKRQQEKEAGSD